MFFMSTTDASQGGAGSFAVLVSVTVKVYPSLAYTFVSYSYNTTSDSDAFWSLTAYWASMLPQLSEAGLMGYHYPVPNDPSEKNTSIAGKLRGYWFGPELSKSEFEAVLAPVNEHIRTAQWGAPVIASNTTLTGDNFSALVATGLGDDDGGIPVRLGSRLLDGKALSKPLAEIKKTLRKAHGLSRGLQIFNLAGPGAREPVGGIPGGSNALLPAWRSAYAHVGTLMFHGSYLQGTCLLTWYPVIPSSWEALNKTAEEQVTVSLREGSVAALVPLAPDAGAYISESDPTEKRWKEVYYGANYEKLLKIKDQWDPKGVFWNKNGVGSDLWELVGPWGPDNGVGQNPVQLCRVA
jgi:hypothetical protein